MFQQSNSTSYMKQLDMWTESVIIDPLVHAAAYGPEAVAETRQTVLKAIRQKVLESYHNGQKAGARKR